MQESLRNQLVQMTDEEFHELNINIQISGTIRDLVEADFIEDEIADRMGLTPEDWNFAINGAYEFTTKHIGIVQAMAKEAGDLIDDDDEEEDNPNDIPTEVNYGIHERDDEVIHLGGGRTLTPQEEAEIEEELREDNKVRPSTTYYPQVDTWGGYKTPQEREMEDLMAKTKSDYDKRKQQEKQGGDSNPSDNQEFGSGFVPQLDAPLF